jgi:hypothetical protein
VRRRSGSEQSERKLIFFYEWDFVLKWTGRLEGGENETEGTINIPNLSEENDISEIVVLVRVKNSDPEADKLTEFLTKDGKKVKQLNKYVVALKEKFSKGMILRKLGYIHRLTQQNKIFATKCVSKWMLYLIVARLHVSAVNCHHQVCTRIVFKSITCNKFE